jgi:hypothetical protein
MGFVVLAWILGGQHTLEGCDQMRAIPGPYNNAQAAQAGKEMKL